MKLYYAPGTRARRVRWLLEEMGVDYELAQLDMRAGEHKSEAYARVHPLGKVPALVDGDVTVFESAAICLYLADKFPDKNMAPPADSPDRGPYLQWAVYGVATVEPALIDLFRAGEDADARAAARAALDAQLAVLDRGIRGPYLLGESFYAVDAMIGSLLQWTANRGWLDGHERAQAYVAAVTARPAYAAGQ
jgi:glutathione S-transferase